MRRFALIPSLAALLGILLTCALGSWQLGRADEKRALQRQLDTAAAQPAIALGPAVTLADVLGRRVVLRGAFEPGKTVFLDNRTRQGVAGFHVLSAFRLADSGRHVLVLRGWIASDPADRRRLPEVPTPETETTLEGDVEADVPQTMTLGDDPDPRPAERLWQHASIDRFATWSGLALMPMLVRQRSDAPDGLARDWTTPGAGVDKHIGYAVQWFAMAAAIAAAWAWFVIVRPRRAASPAERP